VNTSRLLPPIGYCKRCCDRKAFINISAATFLDGAWCRECLELVAPHTYAWITGVVAAGAAKGARQ
jgi:hypothetical protein